MGSNEVALWMLNSSQVWKAACETVTGQSDARERCPQEHIHTRATQCKSRMVTNGKGSQKTSKDKCLCSKEGANAQTQRAAQSMQQVMKRTYYAATQKEVRQEASSAEEKEGSMPTE